MDILSSILEGENFCIQPWKLQVEQALIPFQGSTTRLDEFSDYISIWIKSNF
jgi:hypothetical protein